MTAPAQDWAEKAREIGLCAGINVSKCIAPDSAVSSMTGRFVKTYNWIHCDQHKAIALALSDAARTGRAEDAIEIRCLQTELAEWKARENRAACALADAARMGREEGLEEAKRGLLEMADHLQSDSPISAVAIRNSAELLSALRGKELK